MSRFLQIQAIAHQLRNSRRRDWFKKGGPVHMYWNSLWVGAPLWFTAVYFVVRWSFIVPSPGKAIGALAVVAGIMSVRDIAVLGKILWVFLLICFVIVEFRAIDSDRAQSAKDAVANLKSQQEGFAGILKNQQDSFAGILKTEQDNFTQTISALVLADANSRKQFENLVKRDEDILIRQEQLAESYSGKLIAGLLPTPPNGCSNSQSNSSPTNVLVVILPNGNASLSNHFPHTVLAINQKPVLSLTETSPGVIVPIMDIRNLDGKIVARFDQSGFMIGSRLAVKRPDASTLIVLDEYGEEAVNIHFLNAHAISVSGYFVYQGRKIPMALQNMHNSCSAFSNEDINLNIAPQ